jgi:uncharacterized protein
MNRFIRSAAFKLLLMPAMVSAQDFDAGLDAFVAGDFATALHEWIPLADHGDAVAQFQLGRIYYNGLGVPQDFVEAMKWFRLAADQGHAEAQNNLGLRYLNGKGVPQDYSEAMKWFRLAADQGNAEAQFSLGLMYANSQGMPQDNVSAHMWFNLAAATGDTDSATKRDDVAAKMSPVDVAEAQRRAKVCLASGYQDCD